MSDLLEQKDQNKLIELIKLSELCSLSNKRRAFLIEIGLDPANFNDLEGDEYSFLVNLIHLLVSTKAQEVLKSIANKLQSKICNNSLHSSTNCYELQQLRVKLESVSVPYLPSRPKPKPAYSLDSDSFRQIPFDIGTIWGLQRSSFIGILVGFEGDGIYENLKNVEFILIESIKDNNCAMSLPRREWIQMDLNKWSSLPYDKADILRSAIDLSNQAYDSLKKNSFPELTIPGFFFKINLEQLTIEYSEQIKDWCKILLSELFPLEPVVIIINITSTIGNNITDRIIPLKAKLELVTETVPVEVMHLDHRLFFESYTSYERTNTDRENIRDISREAGLAFLSWIYHAQFHSFLEKTIFQEERDYIDLINFYKEFKTNYSENDLRETYGKITPIEVVLDIQAIAHNKKGEVYEQFLCLIINYLPQKSCELVKAYVESEILDAVHSALIVGANADLLSDTLMDVWVDAINFDKLDIDLFFQEGLFNPNLKCINNLRLEALVLALMRKDPNKRSSKIQNIIQKLVHGLRSLQELNYFYQNQKEQEDDFLSQNNPNQFTFAIRANIKLEQAIEKFKAAPVSYLPSAICWLLATIPPTRSNITEILLLDAKKRAVFGLCTPLEWQKIQERLKKERQVLDCRRKRPLIYS